MADRLPAPAPIAAEQSGPIPVPSPAPIPMAEPGFAADPGARPATSVYSPSRAEQSGPIQVPAPLPIPTASMPSAGNGFGPAQPPQSGRRHRAEPEDELPVLPVRAPGRSYDDLRAGGDGVVTAEDQDDQPPPLPQRRGSHLREELLEPPAVTKPVPGHNTSLMKTFQAGRDSWQARERSEGAAAGLTEERARERGTSVERATREGGGPRMSEATHSTQQNRDANTNRGDSWPTT
jgi:hypothetical protein